MNEIQLIALAKEGDKQAYGKLMALHYRTVEKFAFQVGVHMDDIQDVTQEVFIKLYRFLYQFNSGRLTTWLYQITLNTARDYYRKEAREIDKEKKAAKVDKSKYARSAENKVLLFEEDHALHEAIVKLEEKYRIPLVLFYFQNLSYEQIAEVLTLNISMVKTRLFRARSKLKYVIGGKGGANDGR